MLSLSGLQAFPLIVALAAPTHADAPPVRPIDAQHEERVEQATDVFFHPFGVALILGAIPHDFGPVPPTYPTDPGGPKPPVDPPPSGGKPVGDPPPLGGDPSVGDPPPSGSDPPPTVKNTPEPATLISGMIGAGLVGLVGRRRRKRK